MTPTAIERWEDRKGTGNAGSGRVAIFRKTTPGLNTGNVSPSAVLRAMNLERMGPGVHARSCKPAYLSRSLFHNDPTCPYKMGSPSVPTRRGYSLGTIIGPGIARRINFITDHGHGAVAGVMSGPNLGRPLKSLWGQST